MPAICSGPPGSDGCSTTPPSTAKSAVTAAVEAFRTFVWDFREKKGSQPSPGFSMRPVSTEAKRVRKAQDYMTARLEQRNEDVVNLVSDDIELVSSRDGRIVGKSHFRDYIGRVKPTGTWKPAAWNESIGKAEILGTVRILMINVGVVAHFGFDRTDKINQIYVGTRKKASEQ